MPPLRELPIFPLPLVLFPGAVQPLHIFEPRYREMLADVLAGDRCFGIVFVASEAGENPVPRLGDVGCLAEIRSTQPFGDGRSNIVTVGRQRFTLDEWLAAPRGYRRARVREFKDEAGPADLVPVATEVRRDFQRLLVALAAFTDRTEESSPLADDPEPLSFQVAARLPLEPTVQQELLRLRDTAARLERLRAVLAPLVADLERRSAARLHARRNGRSTLEPDIERSAPSP